LAQRRWAKDCSPPVLRGLAVELGFFAISRRRNQQKGPPRQGEPFLLMEAAGIEN